MSVSLLRAADTVDTIAVVNNAISARMLGEAFARDNVRLDRVAMVSARKLDLPWLDSCAIHVRYPDKPRQSMFAQWRFISFYRQAARMLRQVLKRGNIRRIYVVNAENLLTNHLLTVVAQRPEIELTVVVEGIYNFQEILWRNRARWRLALKPVLSALLGLKWRTPRGHLSGAFEPEVDRIVSFTDMGLKAPAAKVEVLPWEPVAPTIQPDPRCLLVVHTGLWLWMDEASYLHVARSFVEWVRREGFERIIVKHHPSVGPGQLEDLLPPHETWDVTESMEDLADKIPAATVAGTCCTALVTAKLLRPDLRCVDVGADFYCDAAYAGDHSVQGLLRGAGIEIIEIGMPSGKSGRGDVAK
jgi:hypothetical protein